VGAEAVEQRLQPINIVCWSLVTQPFLQRAVEALELAERLRVRGCGADQLDADLTQAALEGDLDAVQPTGEVAAVVREPQSMWITFARFGSSCRGNPCCAAAAAKQAQTASPLNAAQAWAASR